jgi:hypothetical protein
LGAAIARGEERSHEKHAADENEGFFHRNKTFLVFNALSLFERMEIVKIEPGTLFHYLSESFD